MNIVPERTEKEKGSYPSLPIELIRRGKQFVVWKRALRKDGTIGKEPFNARAALSGKEYHASVTNERGWSTYEQACRAYQQGNFDGIGLVLTSGVIFLDIDHCIDQAEQIDPRAREIVNLLQSSTERSPSGDGLHIHMLGHLPPDAHNRYIYKGLKFEVYDSGRYTTLTGERINGLPLEMQNRSNEIATFLQQCQPGTIEENTGGVCGVVSVAGTNRQAQRPAPNHCPTTDAKIDSQAQPLSENDLLLGERIALKKARSAKNGADFEQLWQGGDPRSRVKADGSPDISAADFDLILMLLYWTNDQAEQTARLFRASGRYRPEKGAGKNGGQRLSYLERSIQNAIARRHKVRGPSSHGKPLPVSQPAPSTPAPAPESPARQPARRDKRIPHAHHWMRKAETAEQRKALLWETASTIARQAETHIRTNRRDVVMIQAVAPGVGKTHTVSEIGVPGNGLNLAWIAERKDMAHQVKALQRYTQIEPCTRFNCPEGHHLHRGLAEKSCNTMAAHKRHRFPCHYVQQFDSTASAFMQLAHVKTKYPAKFDGICIDEMDLPKWLPEREITTGLLQATLSLYTTDSTADRLVRAIEATITDCKQSKTLLQGRAFFERLNHHCSGHLYNWIGELAQDSRYLNTHPWVELEETDPRIQEYEVMQLAPVVLPHIMQALIRERTKWKRGCEWNSCMRIGKGPHGWALLITEPLRFTPDKEGNLPARIVLDATAPDDDILSLVLGERVEVHRASVPPPAGTRHLAIRTGKRYGLTSLCAAPHDANGKPLPNRSLLRAAAEIRYLLRELDPDGAIQAAGKVGLVTFLGAEAELGEELKIPAHRRLHFWAARGSNALQDCDLLFVVGTPMVNPETVIRLAHAIWTDDPTPIDPTVKTQDGKFAGFVDDRLDRLNTYLTRAELTQCAHRSRALREARTVITLCTEDIDYLPATETITCLPELKPDGLDAWKARRKDERKRLDQARQHFEEQGKTVHMMRVHELKIAAHVATSTAAEYLRMERRKAQSQEEESTTPTPPPVQDTPAFVPNGAIENIYASAGTNFESQAAPAPRFDLDGEIMRHGRAAQHPEIVLPGVQIPAGSANWSRWMWMSQPTEDQRQAVYAYLMSLSSPPALAG